VLTLAVPELRYRRAPLRFQVSRVREDISGWYGGEWVWLEGRELDTTGYPISGNRYSWRLRRSSGTSRSSREPR
jgi:hypothetical protein